MRKAAQLRGLVKDRGRFRLGPVDLTLPYGYVTALLGANGSGKTTLIKILLGLIAPAGGDVTILGADPQTLAADPANHFYWRMAPRRDSGKKASSPQASASVATRLVMSGATAPRSAVAASVPASAATSQGVRGV